MMIRRCLYFVVLLAATMLVAACNNSDDGGGGQTTCDEGEILVGGACCPDADKDGVCDETTGGGEGEIGDSCDGDKDCRGDLICDADDTCAEDTTTGGGEGELGDSCDADKDCSGDLVCDPDTSVCASDETSSCDDGQVEIGGNCCDDVNANGVCDDEETAADCGGDEIFDTDAGICCSDLNHNGICDDDPTNCADDGGDADGDGFCAVEDCDDADGLVYPGAQELCGYSKVNDCDNDCYGDGNCADPAVYQSAKSGYVGRLDASSNPPQWSDATDDVSGQSYDMQNGETLYFCDVDEANGTRVDLHISGTDTKATIASGLPAPTTAMIGSEEDQAVVTVMADAELTIKNLVMGHESGFSGQNGHGLKCDGASVTFAGRVGILQNSAEKGGGVLAKSCDFDATNGDLVIAKNSAGMGGGIYSVASDWKHGRSPLALRNNQAKRGAAIFFDSSSSENMTGSIGITGNTIDDGESAAVELIKESSIDWTPAGTMPLIFAKNRLGDSGPFLALVVSSGSKIDLGQVSFQPGGAKNTRTDDNDYSTQNMYSAVSCDSSTCVLTP